MIKVEKLIHESLNKNGYDMKVLSLALHFYTNIAASGHGFTLKILRETRTPNLLQFILKNNIAVKN